MSSTTTAAKAATTTDTLPAWGYLRKDETIEDRMRLTQLVDAIERGGFDEHSDNFMVRCDVRMGE